MEVQVGQHKIPLEDFIKAVLQNLEGTTFSFRVKSVALQAEIRFTVKREVTNEPKQ